MNCLIIDDNKMARTAMNQLVSKVDDLTVVSQCSKGMEAYNLMNSQTVLFLDIEMPEMTGLELTRNLGEKKPIIVFTTSKKEYAVDAFEFGYLATARALSLKGFKVTVIERSGKAVGVHRIPC